MTVHQLGSQARNADRQAWQADSLRTLTSWYGRFKSKTDLGGWALGEDHSPLGEVGSEFGEDTADPLE